MWKALLIVVVLAIALFAVVAVWVISTYPDDGSADAAPPPVAV